MVTAPGLKYETHLELCNLNKSKAEVQIHVQDLH